MNEGTTASPVNVPQMVDQRGKIHPRRGCRSPAPAATSARSRSANIELENTDQRSSTPCSDPIRRRHEVATAAALRIPGQCRSAGGARPTSRASPFIAPEAAPLCGESANARPDVLTDEPGGYNGFLALFGNKYVAPAINRRSTASCSISTATTSPTASATTVSRASTQRRRKPRVRGANARSRRAGRLSLHRGRARQPNYPGRPASNPDGAFGPGEAAYVCQLEGLSMRRSASSSLD